MSLSFIHGDITSLAHRLGSESQDGSDGAKGVSVKTGFAHWLSPSAPSSLPVCSQTEFGDNSPQVLETEGEWDSACLSRAHPWAGLWECGSLLSPGLD